MSAAETSQRENALDGLVIADFSRVLSGPIATMLLGDLGADVIKVERPGAGDDTRAWGPPWTPAGSSYYLAANRNKRSLTLDLTAEDGRGAARKLIRRSDVVVENFRPGTMERFGLGYGDLKASQPGLVYCAITGFGRDEGAGLVGYDLLIQALGGLMSITGEADGSPMKVGVALVDVIAGLFATVGILAAVRHRERTGEGQRVDVNLLSSLLSALANQSSAYAAAGVVAERLGNAHPSIAPYETLQTGDGLIVMAVGTDRQFASLCSVIGGPELAADTRFHTNPQRVANRPALRDELERLMASRSAADWAQALTARRVPCGQVNDIGAAFELAQRLGLTPVHHVTRSDGEQIGQVANPIGLSATPARYDLAPPALGEHAEQLGLWLESNFGRREQP
jgi:crotonobetainyl-CoA:carnitine CoA-transferase CaiB-like acyl-CoA transferase